MTSADASQPDGSRLYRYRWPLRILLVFLVPVLLLGGVELVLRVTGSGYDWRLFVPVDGTDLVAANPEFGYRFFPRAVARKPLLNSFPAEKSPDTYRIFVLGASAAAGVPNSTYSFAQILDVFLESRYPGVDFEMVNTSMPAINSHVVAPIAEECARFDPDLFIVYLGNNEVIGPFSSGSADQRSLATTSVIRATVNFRKTRIGQLVQSVGEGLAGGNELDEWGGMAQYAENFLAEDDPVLDRVYANFKTNLETVIAMARGAGARTLLSTVSVNLANNAPFASLHPADWTAEDEAEWSGIYTQAGALADQGACEEASMLFRRCLDLDPGYAEAHYRLARCLIQGGDRQQAETHFRRALDLDALRFRSGTGINGVIRETALANRAEDVHLVDTEKLITDLSRRNGTLPGKDLFFEHVHFRFLGNYLVARAMLDAVEAGLPTSIRARATQAEVPPPPDCARILALTPFNRYRMLSDIYMMVKANPFTNQYDQPATLAEIEAEMAELRDPANVPDPMDLVRAYQQALDARPEDLLLRFNYAIMVAELGDPVEANRQLDILRARVPDGSLPPDLVKTNPGGGR